MGANGQAKTPQAPSKGDVPFNSPGNKLKFKNVHKHYQSGTLEPAEGNE